MIAEYNTEGRIVHVIHDPVPPELLTFFQQREDQTGYVNIPYVEDSGIPRVLDPALFYIDIAGEDKYLAQRPPLPIELEEYTVQADGVDEIVFNNLPDPCSILLDGVPTTVTGGELTIASDMPAEYVIQFRAFPYQDKTVKVTAL